MLSNSKASERVLEVEGLSCQFETASGTARILRDVSLTIETGTTLGIVGESGAGKSMLIKAIMGIAPKAARVTGKVMLGGVDLLALEERERRTLLGRHVGIVFQNPATSLNPFVRVGRQIEEASRYHMSLSKSDGRQLAIELLATVGIADPADCYDQYPHQFSGGMKQRIMIATALACQPDLLIADEATTALDVTVQKEILDLLQTIQQKRRMSMILVTHDLGVVAGRTDEVAVMYGGRIVERSPTEGLFRTPRHRYTEALLSAMPRIDQPAHTTLRTIAGSPPDLLRPLPGCPFAPRCSAVEARCTETMPERVTTAEDSRHSYACYVPVAGAADAISHAAAVPMQNHPAEIRQADTGTYLREDALLKVRDLTVSFQRGRQTIQAVAGVSFDVARGETLGLVGESGSGKTTIGRALLRLLPEDNSGMTGSVEYGDEDLGTLSKARMRDVRRHLQMIFQDPLSSFNPRRTVWDIVGEGLAIQGMNQSEITGRSEAALIDVGMSRSMVAGRRPHQFSGGQCQRIAIARALALGPDLIVCDEPVASLDVSVQAHVINLLQKIKQTRNLALIFISHDLAVVKNVSDRVAVLYMGKIVETGAADLIYDRPAHPYTRTLLEAVPRPDASVKLKPEEGGSDMPSRSRPPSGCRFRTRCPRAATVCAELEPELRPVPNGQFAACHFPHD